VYRESTCTGIVRALGADREGGCVCGHVYCKSSVCYGLASAAGRRAVLLVVGRNPGDGLLEGVRVVRGRSARAELPIVGTESVVEAGSQAAPSPLSELQMAGAPREAEAEGGGPLGGVLCPKLGTMTSVKTSQAAWPRGSWTLLRNVAARKQRAEAAALTVCIHGREKRGEARPSLEAPQDAQLVEELAPLWLLRRSSLTRGGSSLEKGWVKGRPRGV